MAHRTEGDPEVEVSWTQGQRTAAEKAQQRIAPPLPTAPSLRPELQQQRNALLKVLRAQPDRTWTYGALEQATTWKRPTLRRLVRVLVRGKLVETAWQPGDSRQGGHERIIRLVGGAA